jgi:hypothetical protein
LLPHFHLPIGPDRIAIVAAVASRQASDAAVIRFIAVGFACSSVGFVSERTRILLGR